MFRLDHRRVFSTPEYSAPLPVKGDHFFEQLRREQPIKYFGKGAHVKYQGVVDCHARECCGPVCADFIREAKRRELEPHVDPMNPQYFDTADVLLRAREEELKW